MRCPYCCYNEARVIDTRDSGHITRRRRECLKCKKRFTTYEDVEAVDLRIIKKDGNIEAFDRNKLLKGILTACEKRPIKTEQIQMLIDGVEIALREQNSIEVQSKLIGTLVMDKLKKLDEIAYIRFASVYREFEDLKSFEEEIKLIR